MNKGKNKKIKKEVQNSIATLRYKDISEKERSKIREKGFKKK